MMQNKLINEMTQIFRYDQTLFTKLSGYFQIL